MTNNNKVHQYETCVSTGPQHLNPDPEILTIGETACAAHPGKTPVAAILAFAGINLGPEPESEKTIGQLAIELLQQLM